MTTRSTPRLVMNGASKRWRILANNRPIAMAVLAGLVATHIATIFGFWFHGLGLPNLDWPRFNGYLLFRAAWATIRRS